MVIVVRFTKDPNLHKKAKVLSILEVVVKRISSCQNGLQCHLVKNKTPVGQHKSPVLWIKFYLQFWILAKLTLLYFKTKDINGRLTCPVMAKSLTHHMLSWRYNNCLIFFGTIIVDWQKNYWKNHISLLNLVNSSWLWKISQEITANQRWRIFVEHLNKVY